MENSFFPYDKYRTNQEEFIQFVQASLIHRKNPIVEAATGFGKTISVLSAVLPVAEKFGKKIVYCCRTHKQMDRVMEELMEIGKKAEISGISIKGKVQCAFIQLSSIMIWILQQPFIFVDYYEGRTNANFTKI